MKGINFLKNPEYYRASDAFVVFIWEAKTKAELLQKIAESFNFPNYLGLNWHALLDLLCDLNWIDKKSNNYPHRSTTE